MRDQCPMQRWQGKVAIITGASSGIGAATCVRMANEGFITFGLARRKERIEKLLCRLDPNAKGKLIPIKCDCSLEFEVKETFEQIGENYGPIQVLVNCAGVNKKFLLTDCDNSQNVREVINTNLLGPVYCIREAYKSMKCAQFGHIININSVLGQKVIYFGALDVEPMNIYPSTKYAITALTEVLRQEMQVNQTPKIKVTSLSPGLVRTAMGEQKESKPCENNILEAEDIAAAIIYVLSTPEHVQISELTIRSVGEQQ